MGWWYLPYGEGPNVAIRHLELRDVTLEAHDLGTGEPVVFIQTALIADELLPLARELALADGFRRIVYHRRGYVGSSPVAGQARSGAMRPTPARRCWLPFGSNAPTLLACPTAALWPFSSRPTHPTVCAVSS
jgi:hypothetical protein